MQKSLRSLHMIYTIASLFAMLGCQKPAEDAVATGGTTGTGQYLYVASGACYSGGGITTFTNLSSSNLIYRINPITGNRDIIVADYSANPSNAGDTPVSLISDSTTGSLYALVDNTTTTSLRRIEKLNKTLASSRTIFSNNTTALSSTLRDLLRLPSGDFAVTKANGIELITTSNVRVGAPYINPSAAPCATTNTGLTRTLQMTNGKFMFLHAATGQNRIGTMVSTGGTTCATATAAPNAAAFPTAAVYDSANSTLIVAYGGSTAGANINIISAYSVNETTGALGAEQRLYDVNGYPATYPYLLYGISAMAYDSANKQLYVATAISPVTTVANYSIEKFNYDFSKIGSSNTTVLTRVGSTPFYSYGNDTKCIASMILAP